MSGIEARVSGSAELKKLADQIRVSGDKGLGPKMAQALKRASQPVQRSIRGEYGTLPSRGGYSGLFSKSLRFRTTLRSEVRKASFRMLTFADGTHQRRDILALERGSLRHPVYGRSRGGRKGERLANPWAVTRVKGDFHKRGTDHAAEEAEKEMSRVIDQFTQDLIK
jgi:hypothetical protein